MYWLADSNVCSDKIETHVEIVTIVFKCAIECGAVVGKWSIMEMLLTGMMEPIM